MVCAIFLSGTVLTAQAQDAGARLQNLQREFDQRKAAPQVAPSPDKKETEVSAPEIAESKILVKAFKITGVTLITEDQAKAAVASYLNQELTFAQIQEAAQRIADLYTPLGRLALPVIPEQDVVDGVIEIRIIEAKAGSVLIKPATEGQRLRLRESVVSGFVTKGNTTGQLLSLDRLNRSKVIVNELPGVAAQIALTKSSTDGSSDIEVSLQEASLVTGRVEGSNTGSASTGVFQNTWSLNINSPAGLGDAVNIDAAFSEGSSFATLRYWLPAGYEGWRIAPGFSALNYRSLSSFSATISSGSAHVVGLYATYPWLRSTAQAHSFNFNAEVKEYQNFSNDIESSAYSISKFNTGLSGSSSADLLAISYALTLGVGSLDLKNGYTADQTSDGPQTAGNFSKLSLNLALGTDLPLPNTSARVMFNGQLASKNLNSSEQLYLGGPDSVRAYPVAQGGGSQGYVASLEINRTYAAGLQLGAFVDVGVIQQYKFNWPSIQAVNTKTQADNMYSLGAAGLTAKYSWQNFQLQGVMAFRVGDNPLRTNKGEQLNTDNGYRDVQAWVRGTYFFN